MPRIPNREVEDDFDDYDDFNIDDDDQTDRMGRRVPAKEHRKNRDWEDARKQAWQKRNRDDY